MDASITEQPRSLARGLVELTPAATDEEAVAIAAALDALWPRPVMSDGGPDRRAGVWKFSGRWWSQPIPLRRARPWV